MLCKWHIGKNIKGKCYPYFRDLPTIAAGSADEEWDRFLNDCDAVVESLTIAEYTH
jgi:hypothetical protein